MAWPALGLERQGGLWTLLMAVRNGCFLAVGRRFDPERMISDSSIECIRRTQDPEVRAGVVLRGGESRPASGSVPGGAGLGLGGDAVSWPDGWHERDPPEGYLADRRYWRWPNRLFAPVSACAGLGGRGRGPFADIGLESSSSFPGDSLSSAGSGALFGLSEAIGRGFDGNDFTSMDQAVDESDDAGGVWKDLVPFGEGFVGGDQQRFVLIAFGNNFEE